MALQTSTKTLDEVQIFANNPYLHYFDDVFTVFVGNKTPVCLKSHAFYIDQYDKRDYNEFRMIRDIHTSLQTLGPNLHWKMNVQYSMNNLRSRDELEKTLKNIPAVFGVWGEEQLAYFSKYLDNVVDIAPLVMEKVKKFDRETDDVIVKPYEKCLLDPLTTLGELFLYVLRDHAARRKEQGKEKYSIEQFKKFIEDEAWESFLCSLSCW